MKKAFYILILLSVSRQTSGQINLVMNPSFESYTACPDLSSDVNKIVNWDAAKGSPDFFNSCSTNTLADVPVNFFGTQYPINGNTYCGFYAYDPSTPQYREILIGKLSTTLTIGQKYFVSFKVNRADAPLIVEGSCNKIGARFTKNKINLGPLNVSNYLYDNFAHVYSNNIISDTLNWTKISGSFIADSAYQYIMIGNFFFSANTTVIYDGNNTTMCYYYVDEICTSTDSTFAENYVTGIINNSQNKDFSIFPNPTSDYISITLGQLKYADLIISNKFGQTVLAKTVLASDKIDIGNLTEGLYFIRMSSGNKIYNAKLIIRH